MSDPFAPAVLVVIVVNEELAEALIALELDRLSDGNEEDEAFGVLFSLPEAAALKAANGSFDSALSWRWILLWLW